MNTPIALISKLKYSGQAALVDLVIFIAVMFLVRTFEIPGLGFMGNALFNSLSTLVLATVLLYYRGQSWKDLGLRKPKSTLKMIGIAFLILGAVIFSAMFFEIFIRDLLPQSIASEDTAARTDSRFSELVGNVSYFFSIIFLVWLESCLEEMLDRGYLQTRIESVFSKIPLSVVIAVVGQAVIFGFRHSPSHGIAGALLTGIIGLVFGIAYVVFGRNLWSLMIAHCILNSMSMIDRLFAGF